MSYIDEIFKRLDIQHIREFLLHGVDESEISSKAYKERIDEARDPVIEFIQQKFEPEECEEITGRIYDYASVCENVYMEIGIKCGAKIAAQLFEREDPPHD